ncbi:MAG: HRDC domain-containing protein [Planctomycetota bacterium]
MVDDSRNEAGDGGEASPLKRDGLRGGREDHGGLVGFRPYRSRHREDSDAAAHADLEESGQAGAKEELDPEHGPVNRPELVTDQAGVNEVVERLRTAGSFAYDTEFIGEESYFPRLCVIQAATAERVELIDPMADGVDLSGFWELLADEGVRVIVHAGLQDLEPVLRHTGRPPANILDTQVAAGFAGMGYPLSLANLVLELLGADMGKGLKFSRWDRRPLSEVQLRYAANDVRYLPAAAKLVEERVEQLRNTAAMWAAQGELCEASNFEMDPLQRKVKARGAGALGRRKRAVLNALLLWREGLAEELDVPPRSLLGDPVVVDLAGAMPRDEKELAVVKGVPRPLKQQYGERLLGVIAGAKAGPLPKRVAPPPRQDDELRAAVESVWALVEGRCAWRSVSPAVVTSKKALARLVIAAKLGHVLPESPLLQGWRWELMGGDDGELARVLGAEVEG